MDKQRHISMMIALLLLASVTAAVGKTKKDDGRSLSVGKGIEVSNKKVQVTPLGMSVSFDLVLDGLYLSSDKRLVLNPVVRGDSIEHSLPQVVVNGRRQSVEYERKDYRKFPSDVTVVRRHNGTAQTLPYTSPVLPFSEWMWNSDVLLGVDVCGCGDVLGNDAILVWSIRSPKLAYVRPDAKPKTYSLSGSAYIDFPVDKTELHPDYRRNPQELEKIISTINTVNEDRNITINSVDICGYASPEGSYEHNQYLSANRAATLSDYVRKHLENISDSTRFTVSSVAENWAGLREAVDKGELPNKGAIISLIDDDSYEPDAKEWKIKSTFPEDYAVMLQQYYPALRRSDYTVSYTVRAFSVEEAKVEMKTNPRSLSLEEMFLVAQTYEPGSEEFNEVFSTAVRMYPEDQTANLNAACAEIEGGNLDAAETYLRKAGDTPEAMNARGVIAVKRGDNIKAEQLFQNAKDRGLEVAGENLELISTGM